MSCAVKGERFVDMLNVNCTEEGVQAETFVGYLQRNHEPRAETNLPELPVEEIKFLFWIHWTVKIC